MKICHHGWVRSPIKLFDYYQWFISISKFNFVVILENINRTILYNHNILLKKFIIIN